MNNESPRRAATARPVRADGAPLYQLAYEEGRRTVDDQMAELSSIRQNTVQFLAFVGATTGFLIGAGLPGIDSRGPSFYFIAISATVLSIVSVSICASILTASRHFWGGSSLKWSFRLLPGNLMKWVDADIPPTPAQFYSKLAEVYAQMEHENSGGLKAIRARYVAFLITGFAQLCAWVSLVWIFA